jgi:hypothetical protein
MPPGASHHKLEYQGRPGGFGHARAIEAMGDSYAPRGSLKVYAKTGPDADVIKTSLYNTARMMIARQLDAARAHLAQARKSARRIGPQATADIEAVAASLDDVPAGVSRRMTDQPNALLNQRGHLRGTLQTQFAAEPADQWKIIDLAVRSASLDFSQAGARPAAGQKPAPAASSRSQAASAEARVPKGQFGGGRFGSGGGTKTASKPQQSAASKARQKAGLLATARTDRAKAHALGITLAGLLKQQRAANASKAQATKAGATGKAASSTPAAKTTPAKTTAAAKKAPALPPLATRIATLRTQISQLNQAAAAATAQAARL